MATRRPPAAMAAAQCSPGAPPPMTMASKWVPSAVGAGVGEGVAEFVESGSLIVYGLRRGVLLWMFRDFHACGVVSHQGGRRVRSLVFGRVRAADRRERGAQLPP